MGKAAWDGVGFFPKKSYYILAFPRLVRLAFVLSCAATLSAF